MGGGGFVLYLRETSRASVFVGQKDTSHLSAQSLIVARSLFICWVALISSEKSMKRVVSSAKRRMWELTFSVMSFI